MIKSYFIIVFLLLLNSTAYSENYQFISQWGDQRPDLSQQTNAPRGVAVDANRNVYVSDTIHNRIIKYDNDGNILKTWSDCNGSPINYPMEMAVDSNNNLYVVEMVNNRVCVYNSEGMYIKTIVGNFYYPIGVAVDDSFNVYVTDRRNHVVKKFDSTGKLVGTWAGFSGPWGITIYGDFVYVAESGNKVKKLTKSGVLIKEWGSSGIEYGQFFLAAGIAAHNNLLYVADIEHHRIQVFDLEGNFIKIIGERGTGNGQLQFPTALAVDRTNNWLYVTDDDNNRIVKFNLDPSPDKYGTYLSQWGCDSSGNTGLRYPTKIAIDNNNDIMYVVDSGNHRIIKMTLDMQVLGTWGGYGDGDGQFRYPIDVAVDTSGDIYVLDNVKRNIQRFNPDGSFLAKWNVNFDTRKYLYGLHGIDVDKFNNIYVIDADTNKAYKLDSFGEMVTQWPVDPYSTGVTTDSNDFVYITAFNNPNDRIKKFDSNGVPVNSYTNSNGEPVNYIGPYFSNGLERLFHPWDVAVVENGNILVTDTFQHRVIKFDANGNYITQWGSTGGIADDSIEPGKFAFPYGIAVDKYGYVYVADTNNHRIQKFVRIVFNDVPATYWALSQINKIYDYGITVGCGNSRFCPENTVTRAEMAVFLGRGIHGRAYVPQTATGVFSDVPKGYWAANWIEQFYRDGITKGCSFSPLNYCPDDPVTRAQMAVFLLRAKYGANYIPPTATGTRFTDVPQNDLFADWIEQLATEGITVGCGGGNYCPNNPVTRAQMAVFLTRTFNLQ